MATAQGCSSSTNTDTRSGSEFSTCSIGNIDQLTVRHSTSNSEYSIIVHTGIVEILKIDLNGVLDHIQCCTVSMTASLYEERNVM